MLRLAKTGQDVFSNQWTKSAWDCLTINNNQTYIFYALDSDSGNQTSTLAFIRWTQQMWKHRMEQIYGWNLERN
jgi:hypothetical protein